MGNCFRKCHCSSCCVAPEAQDAVALGEYDSVALLHEPAPTPTPTPAPAPTPTPAPAPAPAPEPEPQSEATPDSVLYHDLSEDPDPLGPVQQFLARLFPEYFSKKPVRKMRKFQRLRNRRVGVTLPPPVANKRFRVFKPPLPPAEAEKPLQEGVNNKKEEEKSGAPCPGDELARSLETEGGLLPPESTPGTLRGHYQPSHSLDTVSEETQGVPECGHGGASGEDSAQHPHSLAGQSDTEDPASEYLKEGEKEEEEEELEEITLLDPSEEASRPLQAQEDLLPTAGRPLEGHLRPCHWVDSPMEEAQGNIGNEKPESSCVLLFGPSNVEGEATQ